MLASEDVAFAEARKLVPVDEYSEIALDDDRIFKGNRIDLYPEVAKLGIVSAGLKDGRLILRTTGWVGIVPLNALVALDIRPRVPVKSIDRLVRRTNAMPEALPPHLRTYAATSQQLPALLDFYALSLVNSVSVVLANGLDRGYTERREVTASPRGRILFGETINGPLARGITHKVASSWYEATVNVPVNQCLKYALWFVAQRLGRIRNLRSTQKRLLSQVNALFVGFDGVELEHSRRWLTHIRKPLPDHRSYYRDALSVAELIVREHSVSLDRITEGDVFLATMLVEMEDLFEDYVRLVLRDAAAAASVPVDVLNGMQRPPIGANKMLFDKAPSMDASPDIVIAPRDATNRRVVIEVKYKPVKAWPERDDLNQLLTYALSYATEIAVLVHPKPKGGASGLTLLGTIGRLHVYRYAFDLGARLADQEDQAFADALLDLAEVPNAAAG